MFSLRNYLSVFHHDAKKIKKGGYGLDTLCSNALTLS